MQALFAVYGPTSPYAPVMRVSNGPALILYEYIRELLNKTPKEKLKTFEFAELSRLQNDFRGAWLAELNTLDSYLVAKKEPYDTFILLTRGETLFPAELWDKAPDAIADAREAGKCLAFELPTACGFHVFRVVETVLRRYYAVVTSGKAQPKVRSIGIYTNAIRNANVGDEKILSVLDGIAKLHRNPLIHPEVVLTMEEAKATVGMAQSAVMAMLTAIPIPPPTTALLPQQE